MTPYKNYELMKWLQEETFYFFKNDKKKFKNVEILFMT